MKGVLLAFQFENVNLLWCFWKALKALKSIYLTFYHIHCENLNSIGAIKQAVTTDDTHQTGKIQMFKLRNNSRQWPHLSFKKSLTGLCVQSKSKQVGYMVGAFFSSRKVFTGQIKHTFFDSNALSVL